MTGVLLIGRDDKVGKFARVGTYVYRIRGKGGRHSIPVRQREPRPSIAHMENSDNKILVEPRWEAGGRIRGGSDGGCSMA